MKSSGKLLERICKRVRRTRSKTSKTSASEEEIASKLRKPSVEAGMAVDISVVEQRLLSASLRPGMPAGTFRDSSTFLSPPSSSCCMAAGSPSSRSLPARMDGSGAVTSSSAPLLHPTRESCVTADLEADSTRHEECIVPSPSSVSSPALQTLKGEGPCMLSATDSGLYSEEEDSIEEFLEVFSEDEDDYDEEDGSVEDGWLIPADEMSLDKVVTANGRETVYSGYWHGNVAVHALCSNTEETRGNILADVSTLSNIRHENIQLFLGVCHDLHSDYISIVMDQMKGESLHTLIHKQNRKFNFQSLAKITNQVAQGMEYLHAKGIPHPLLTSQSVTLHFRACISMLTPGSASMGVLNSTDLSYLPPEVMRTVTHHPSTCQTSSSCPSSPHSIRGLQSRCSSTSSRRLPSSTTGWTTPTSPSLSLRRQVDSRGYLGVATYSQRGGSCDDLRSDAQLKQRTQLKGDVSTMQTYQANVYSFGTLLYEMLASEKPFSTTAGNLIIYKVGKGAVHDLSSLQDGKLKHIIRRCWRKEPEARPSFQDILLKLEQNMSPKSCGLKSHFSFSVPNQLDKLGCFESGGLNL